ncbi:MAG: hypothetical protein DDT26_00851 [Dehalococcoidia bacterium]|nr:hypothetical protein [Chloroflexota bacterium]
MKQQRCKKRPIIGPFEEIVDTWLLEDSLSPKKQRHTARRIYDRLVSEHEFSGGERTVREYVARRKHELWVQEQERYAKLEHPGGEAQADFKTVKVVENGQLKEIKCLVLSFPFSNAGFPYAVPAENAECFLEALKCLFERMFQHVSVKIIEPDTKLPFQSLRNPSCSHVFPNLASPSKWNIRLSILARSRKKSGWITYRWP